MLKSLGIIIITLIALISLIKDKYFNGKYPVYIFWLLIILTLSFGTLSFLDTVQENKKIDEKDNTIKEMKLVQDSMREELSEQTKLIQAKDERILDLEKETQSLKKKSNTIQSLEFQINVDFEEHREENVVSMTLKDKIILFYENNKTIKKIITFENEPQISSVKVSNKFTRTTIIYKPTNPEEIIGKQINYLTNFTTLKIIYANIINLLKFDKQKVNITMTLNGITVIKLNDYKIVQNNLGVLFIDVSKELSKVDYLYNNKFQEQ